MAKIIIFGGFLGSGKTTILKEFLYYLNNISESGKINAAVIENEIGEYSIDDAILQNQGISVKTMFSGCICCTLQTSLIKGIKEIEESYNPEYIFIETTGLAIPKKIKENLLKYLGKEVTICTVTDASRWEKLIVGLAGDFIREQLEEADQIWINKIDTADQDFAEKMTQDLNGFNPDAKILAFSAEKGIEDAVFQDLLKEAEK